MKLSITKKRLRNVLTTVFIVVAVFFLGRWFLLQFSPVPANSKFMLDMNIVRELAANRSMGNLPRAIHTLKVGESRFPSFVVMPRSTRASYPFDHRVFQVVYDDGFILVDPVHSPERHGELLGPGRYDTAAFETMQARMKKARMLVFTHEHFDHLQGVAAAVPLEPMARKIKLIKEQVESPLWEDAGFPIGFEGGLDPIAYSKYYTLAPGVVLIKAPGHTPGSQMIFVRLANGQEYLFLGDLVWHTDNLDKQRARGFLVSWVAGEDRGAVAHQISALKELYAEGQVHFVIAHDSTQNAQLLAAGHIADGLR